MGGFLGLSAYMLERKNYNADNTELLISVKSLTVMQICHGLTLRK
jgi:hypothetical protein